nr:calcium-binding protein [Aliiroseovarius subalbicans]
MFLLLGMLGLGLMLDAFSGTEGSASEAEAEDSSHDDTALVGGPGNDILEATPGDDIVLGGGGDDYLHGGPGNDQLSGGDGADHVHGGSGDDTVYADAGDDLVVGGAGADWLSGGLGDDRVFGEDGNDILAGNGGADMLSGGAGDDLLYGPAGVTNAITHTDLDEGDMLFGGAGNDAIGLGNFDVATGGEGNDTFVMGTWTQPGQAGSIEDFDPAEDALVVLYDPDLNPSPQVSLEQAGADTVILIDGQEVGIVRGVTPALGSIRLQPVELVA